MHAIIRFAQFALNILILILCIGLVIVLPISAMFLTAVIIKSIGMWSFIIFGPLGTIATMCNLYIGIHASVGVIDVISDIIDDLDDIIYKG